MIICETDRIYVILVRTNRRTRWQYATYCGRWKTPEEALEIAKERMGSQPFEYRISDMEDNLISTGFVNWSK